MHKLLMALVCMVGLAPFAMAHDSKHNHLHVSGTGKVTVEPDVGHITLGVVSRDPDAKTALDANTAAMETVYSSLEKLGVKKKEIKTVDFSVQEDRRNIQRTDAKGHVTHEDKLVGFVVSNQVRVTVCDLKSFGKVLAVLVKDGANKVQDVGFSSTKATELMDQARALALKDAKRKAKLMADALEVSVSPVPMEVTEVETHYRPRNIYNARAMAADSGSVPVSGGSLEFVASVASVWKMNAAESCGKNCGNKKLLHPPVKGKDGVRDQEPDRRKYNHPPALKLSKPEEVAKSAKRPDRE